MVPIYVVNYLQPMHCNGLTRSYHLYNGFISSHPHYVHLYERGIIFFPNISSCLVGQNKSQMPALIWWQIWSVDKNWNKVSVSSWPIMLMTPSGKLQINFCPSCLTDLVDSKVAFMFLKLSECPPNKKEKYLLRDNWWGERLLFLGGWWRTSTCLNFLHCIVRILEWTTIYIFMCFSYSFVLKVKSFWTR